MRRFNCQLRSSDKPKLAEKNVKQHRSVPSVDLVIKVGIHCVDRDVDRMDGHLVEQERGGCGLIVVHKRILCGDQCVLARELTVLVDVTKQRVRTAQSLTREPELAVVLPVFRPTM